LLAAELAAVWTSIRTTADASLRHYSPMAPFLLGFDRAVERAAAFVETVE